jgi:hypothetical protein
MGLEPFPLGQVVSAVVSKPEDILVNSHLITQPPMSGRVIQIWTQHISRKSRKGIPLDGTESALGDVFLEERGDKQKKCGLMQITLR